MFIQIIALMLVLLLSGCASGFNEVSLPEDHPAHPNAASTPMPLPSETLAIMDRDRPSEAQADTGEEPVSHGDHSAMGHGNVETEPDSGEKEGKAEGIYACPMHPEVTSNDPGARCPKCGMPLELKE